MDKQKRKVSIRNKILALRMYVLTSIFVILYLSPWWWMLITSFKPPGITFRLPPVWNFTPTFSHYQILFTKVKLQRYLINSFVVVSGSVFLNIAIGALAGYGLSRFRTGGNVIPSVIILSRLIPPMALVVSIFAIARKIGLIDTRIGLIIFYQVFTMPVAAWLFRGYFATIPVAFEDAAMIDGANRAQVLVYIIFPLAKPALAAVTIICTIYNLSSCSNDSCSSFSNHLSSFQKSPNRSAYWGTKVS